MELEILGLSKDQIDNMLTALNQGTEEGIIPVIPIDRMLDRIIFLKDGEKDYENLLKVAMECTAFRV